MKSTYSAPLAGRAVGYVYDGSMSSDLGEPLRFLNDYYRVFSTMDVDAIVAFYHEPTMFVSAQGAYALPTRSALSSAVFDPVKKDLQSRGFGHSAFRLRDGHRVSEGLAVLIGVASRYKADGSELERVGITYNLRKENASWKIVVLTMHEAE
jgi:ketosteroid isomerase-like protein